MFFDVTNKNNYVKSPRRRYIIIILFINKCNLQSCLSCLSCYAPNSRLQWQVEFDFVTFLLLQVIPSITLVCKRFELWIQTQNIVFTRFAVSKNRLRNTIQKSDWLWSCPSPVTRTSICHRTESQKTEACQVGKLYCTCKSTLSHCNIKTAVCLMIMPTDDFYFKNHHK